MIAEAARADDAAVLVEASADAAESAPQRDWLRSRGCTEAQGCFFGASVPAHEVEPVLAAGAARQAA